MNLKDTSKRKINIIFQLIFPVFFFVISIMGSGEAIAYIAITLEIYLILLFLFIFGLPKTVERMMRLKIMKGYYKSADQIFKCSSYLVCIYSVIIAIIIGFSSNVITEFVFFIPYSYLTFIILIGFFVFSSFLLLFQSFFQGVKSYFPTFITQIISSVFLVLFGIFFTIIFKEYGKKAAAFLQNATVLDMYISTGAALALVVSVGISFLVILVFYLGSGRRIRKQWLKADLFKKDNKGRICSNLIRTSFLSTFHILFYHLTIFLGILFFQRELKGIRTENVGIYFVIFEMISLFIILILKTGLLHSEYKIINFIKKDEYRMANNELNVIFQWCILIGMFLLSLSFGLKQSITDLLVGQSKDSLILFVLSFIFVLFVVISILFTEIILGCGLKSQIKISYLSGLACFIIFVLVGLKLCSDSIIILAIGRILFAFVVCVMNGAFVFRKLHFQPEWIRNVLLPGVSVLITGGLLFALEQLLYPYLGNVFMIIVSCIIGSILYFFLLMVLKCVHRKDLKMMPGGIVLEKVGSFLHLL